MDPILFDVRSALIDVRYALAQLRRAEERRSMSIILDCTQRAIDALERVEDALDQPPTETPS
jgi:hypothetical protein